MNQELIESLDNKISDLLAKHQSLKEENARLIDEIEYFKLEREGLKVGIDAILGKLDGI